MPTLPFLLLQFGDPGRPLVGWPGHDVVVKRLRQTSHPFALTDLLDNSDAFAAVGGIVDAAAFLLWQAVVPVHVAFEDAPQMGLRVGVTVVQSWSSLRSCAW